MPGNDRSRGSTIAQLGIVSAIGMAVAGYALFGTRSSQNVAEAATLSPEVAAVLQTRDKLVVTINLSNPDGKTVEGTLRVELRDPGGKVIGQASQQVRQADLVVAHRLELPAPEVPADQLTLRCTLDKQTTFAIKVNGKQVAGGEVTQANADVMQLFDLKEHTQLGRHEVEIQVDGRTNLMYQIVGRYYDPWKGQPAADKPVLDVSVAYDRTELSTADVLKAKATLRYHGDIPTYMVIVDLGVPLGFTVDAGDFAEMVGAKRVQKFSITPWQVTLCIGDVKPGDVKTFDYTLKPKYPIQAKTPSTVAYEYYTPSNRATAPPVELKVSEK